MSIIAIISATATSGIELDKIVYHISVISSTTMTTSSSEPEQLYLQFIILDRHEYNELSSQIMEILQSSFFKKQFESKLILSIF
jgi:hypothetical protein